MRAGFQGHRGARILGEQRLERGPGVGQRAFADELPGGIQHAEVMAAIAQIEPEGEPARRDGSGRRGNNDGRSGVGCVGFQRQTI